MKTWQKEDFDYIGTGCTKLKWACAIIYFDILQHLENDKSVKILSDESLIKTVANHSPNELVL